MKKYIIGNIRKIIYQSNNGPYKIGIFKVRETNDKDLESYVNKIISFTGMINDANSDVEYIFYGKLVFHPKYGEQYNVESYEIKKPDTEDGLVLYLSSGMFKGIGLKTAKKIVEMFGKDTIEIIKNSYESLANVSGMTLLKAKNMHDKVIDNEMNQELIIKLNEIGFSTKEAIDLATVYASRLLEIIDGNIYDLVDLVPFEKLDLIYLKNHEDNTSIRIKALIKHLLYSMCYSSGDTLIQKEELFIQMKKYFKGIFSSDTYVAHLNELIKSNEVFEYNNDVTLTNFIQTEKYILDAVEHFNKTKNKVEISKIKEAIVEYEKRCNIKFNDDQKEAIKGSILNNFFIITGGPGTGKTTIIKAIVEILKDLYDLEPFNFALLAPTGRASKRIAESVLCPAYTIHKYLKWNKETGSFQYDEFNKVKEDIVIIDESSMIDIFLFSSLLKALKSNTRLILVGDVNQLPSIGPGEILNDLINNPKFNKKYLNQIYRVSDGSYITDLAYDIKNKKEFTKFDNKYSDFKFIESNDEDIKKYISEITKKIIKKNISIENFQILAPMYKGSCGIDSINDMMADIVNPNEEKFIINNRYYRVGDKVIQLVNDEESGVYNGDIGYITEIGYVDKKLYVLIDFMGNLVEYKNGEFDKFNLAYAISVHKSQGSEYDNVVIVLAKSFNRMFYNRLVYTAVTRAKKSLIIIGSIDSLNLSVRTTYSENRRTYLKNV